MSTECLPTHVYSLYETAQILGVSEYTVRRYVRDGKLKAANYAGANTQRRVMGSQIISLIEDGYGTEARRRESCR